MKITKNQKRLFVILGLVLCYAIFDIIINLDQYKSLYLGFDKSATQSSNTLIKSKKKIEINTNINPIELTWNRDPFKSDRRILKKEEKKQDKLQALYLQAITYSGNNSLVIINDQILQIGDKIGEYKVQKIYKDKVKLTKLGYTIFLYPK